MGGHSLRTEKIFVGKTSSGFPEDINREDEATLTSVSCVQPRLNAKTSWVQGNEEMSMCSISNSKARINCRVQSRQAAQDTIRLSTVGSRAYQYPDDIVQEEEYNRVDKPLKERFLGSMHNYIMIILAPTSSYLSRNPTVQQSTHRVRPPCDECHHQQ